MTLYRRCWRYYYRDVRVADRPLGAERGASSSARGARIARDERGDDGDPTRRGAGVRLRARRYDEDESQTGPRRWPLTRRSAANRPRPRESIRPIGEKTSDVSKDLVERKTSARRRLFRGRLRVMFRCQSTIR